MPPATRASTKRTAIADAREIVSWSSAVTGEILHYERFHVFEDEGEVLFVQLRVTDDGELVPWTIDSEDEDKSTIVTDGSHSEKEEADTDFIPHAEEEEEEEADTDFVPGVRHARRRQTMRINRPTPLPTKFYYAPSYAAFSLPALLLTALATPVYQPSPPAGRHFAAPVVNFTEDMFELEEGEAVLDLIAGPLSEAILQRTSQCNLPSLLRNFRLSDLSEVNGAIAHAIEKDFYETIRPGKFRANRWVLDPRPTIFRPTNPDYKELAGMGPY